MRGRVVWYNKKSQVSLLLKNTSTIEIYNNHNNKRHNDDAVPCDVYKASDNNTPSKGEMRACRVAPVKEREGKRVSEKERALE